MPYDTRARQLCVALISKICQPYTRPNISPKPIASIIVATAICNARSVTLRSIREPRNAPRKALTVPTATGSTSSCDRAKCSAKNKAP